MVSCPPPTSTTAELPPESTQPDDLTSTQSRLIQTGHHLAFIRDRIESGYYDSLIESDQILDKCLDSLINDLSELDNLFQ